VKEREYVCASTHILSFSQNIIKLTFEKEKLKRMLNENTGNGVSLVWILTTPHLQSMVSKLYHG
jgi:hypothetical protein